MLKSVFDNLDECTKNKDRRATNEGFEGKKLSFPIG
jgi:hypothetical protein